MYKVFVFVFSLFVLMSASAQPIPVSLNPQDQAIVDRFEAIKYKEAYKPNNTVARINEFNALRKKVDGNVLKAKNAFIAHAKIDPRWGKLVKAVNEGDIVMFRSEMKKPYTQKVIKLRELGLIYDREMTRKLYLESVYDQVRLSKAAKKAY